MKATLLDVTGPPAPRPGGAQSAHHHDRHRLVEGEKEDHPFVRNLNDDDGELDVLDDDEAGAVQHLGLGVRSDVDLLSSSAGDGPRRLSSSSSSGSTSPSIVAQAAAGPYTAAVVVRQSESQGNTHALIAMFIVSLVLLSTTLYNFPPLRPDEYERLRFPRDLETLRDLSALLTSYKDENFYVVLSGFCCAYMFLQTFAIPGAIFLSVLAGPLFGKWLGLVVVSCVATTGSSACYMMSFYLGRGLVQRCFPSQLESFREKIREHRDNLFFYLLFLRIGPIVPNWFVNVSSPILNVPLHLFAGATLLGLIPANYIHVTTGLTLGELQSVGGINWKSIVGLFLLAFVALIPTLFKSKFESMDKRSSSLSSHRLSAGKAGAMGVAGVGVGAGIGISGGAGPTGVSGSSGSGGKIHAT